MKYLTALLLSLTLLSCTNESKEVPEHFKEVDQVIWVIDNLENVIDHWGNLGFSQVLVLDTVEAVFKKADTKVPLRLAVANLGGASITWIQPLEANSVFSEFHASYGDGAMSLVHRLGSKDQLDVEIERLSELGVKILDEINISTDHGDLNYTLMDTRGEGKYILGYTSGDSKAEIWQGLLADNRHEMKINQYAFAINKAEDVSIFWAKLGFPEFQINSPELPITRYYGEIVDHELIQGWQRHGTVAYEWCIPVKPPIVYEDHIKLHGEGIHHLAFTVDDMDAVLNDYVSRDYVITMGGTWGDEGKPGSGRYEYIGLDDAGGVTMELLWSYKE